MLRNRPLITLVLILFLALPGAYAQTLSPADSLAVFDANGKRIAAVQGTYRNRTSASLDHPLVILEMNGLLLAVGIFRDKFTGVGLNLLFESSDCSGKPWARNRKGQFGGVAVLPPIQIFRSTAFVADLSVPPQILTPGSRLQEDDNTCDPFFEPELHSVVPVLEFAGLFAQFTPPFSIQVEPGLGGPNGSGLAGPPNFPTLIRGGGSSSQVVVGAGDTALSINTSFNAPDGSLIETQSIAVPPNGTSSIDFEGGDLEFGSLGFAVEPPDGHLISTEIISLAGAPPLGVPPSPLCSAPDVRTGQEGNQSQRFKNTPG